MVSTKRRRHQSRSTWTTGSAEELGRYKRIWDRGPLHGELTCTRWVTYSILPSQQLFIALSHQGRTILGDRAANILRSRIPDLTRSLVYSSQDQVLLNDFVDCIEDQESLRSQINDAGLFSDTLRPLSSYLLLRMSVLQVSSLSLQMVPFCLEQVGPLIHG